MNMQNTRAGATPDEFARAFPSVVKELLGEPNPDLSKPDDLRYGTHGSLSVDPAKGQWFDHELNEGGGVLALIQRETGCDPRGAGQWLKDRGLLQDAPKVRAKIVKTYDYVDEAGGLLFQACRMEPKSFRQRAPDGQRWKWTVKGIRQVPYRLPELLAAPEGALVYVCEGEKDVDRLRDLGLVATCNAGGAGKWREEFAQYLTGKRVAVLPDNDDAGRDHARKVLAGLRIKGIEAKIVTLPDLPEKGDVSDWLDRGGSMEALQALYDAAEDVEVAPDHVDQDDDPLDLSHDGLALEMGRRGFDVNAKYVAPWGKWLMWDRQRWKVDDRLQHLTLTREFLRKRANELLRWAERKAAANPDKAQTILDWAENEARSLKNKHTVAAVETLTRSNGPSVAGPDDFDSDLMLLGTPAGTVDLRTGKMRTPRREDMITKQTSVSPESGTPERWLQFLHEIFAGDQELISFMQRAAGYALTGSTAEHKLLFFYGTGRNGKSVFLNTLVDIWGDYARRSAASTFLHTNGDKHPTDIAGLQGARLVAGSELPKGKTWDESVIKDMTGGDRMTARFMRGDFFDFDPQLTLMIAGNNMPSFRGVDEAIRSRVVLVPFTVTIPAEKRDKGLQDKLKAEAGKILAWAIEGARMWQEIGLAPPDKIAAASTDYLDEEDMIGQFLKDETTADPTAFTLTADIYKRFQQWCEAQGLTPWTRHTLRKELLGRGFRTHKQNIGQGFIGLSINRL